MATRQTDERVSEGSQRPVPTGPPARSRQAASGHVFDLQRSAGNQAVSRLIASGRGPTPIQRTLDPKARSALELAAGKNPTEVSQNVYGDDIGTLTYAEAKTVIDQDVPVKEQKGLVDVGGGGVFSKLKGARSDVREFVRAFVLKGFAQALHSFKNNPAKQSQKPKNEKAARKWERSNHERYFGIAKNVRDQYKPLVQMRPTAPEVQAFLRSEGLEEGMEGSDTEKAGELARGPRIDVRSSYSGSQRKNIRMKIHLFIVYTAANGMQWYVRGGPGEEVDDPELGHLDDGYVTADVGRYGPGEVDWDPAADSVTVLKGVEASAKFDAMVEAAQACSDAKVPYKMLTKWAALEGENCNATAWTVLSRAGVPTRKPAGVHPGWGKALGRQSKTGRGLEPKKDRTPTVTFSKKIGVDGAELFKDRLGADVLATLAAGTDVSVLEGEGDTVKVKVAGTGEVGWMSASRFEPDVVYVPKNPPKPTVTARPGLLAGKDNEIIVTYFPDRDVANPDVFFDGNKPIEVIDDNFEFGRPDMGGNLFLVQQVVFGQLLKGRVRGAQILPTNKAPIVDDKGSDVDSGEDVSESVDVPGPQEESDVPNPQEESGGGPKPIEGADHRIKSNKGEGSVRAFQFGGGEAERIPEGTPVKLDHEGLEPWELEPWMQVMIVYLQGNRREYRMVYFENLAPL